MEGYDLPGSESQRAARILRDAGFDTRAGTQAQNVVASEAGLRSVDSRDQVARLVDEARRIDRNWWLPRWLDRVLPHLAVEGHPAGKPVTR